MSNPRAFSYIRWSSVAQSAGDSLRRQQASAIQYCAEHALDLVDASAFIDAGVSGYSVKSKDREALSRFIDQIGSNLIPVGSYLLIENMDRLSRESITQSLPLFLNIVNSGINLVTLSDGKVYSNSDSDITLLDIMVVGFELERANSESVRKSEMGLKTWEHKRAEISTNPSSRKLTKIAPAWFRLSVDRTEFVPIPERVKIVREMFDSCIAGIGLNVIADRLNDRGITPWGKGKKRATKWRSSYIVKCLSNRAVLGEYQMNVVPLKQRTGSPDEITVVHDYYPAIVSESIFYQAMDARASRKLSGGRRGSTFNSLFSGLLVCGYCDSVAGYRDKSRGYVRLECLGKCGCSNSDYRLFESVFLKYVKTIDYQTMLTTSSTTSEFSIQSCVNSVKEQKGKLLELARKHSDIMDMIIDYKHEKLNPARLQTRIREIDNQIDIDTGILLRLESELDHQRGLASRSSLNRFDVIGLIDSLADESALYETRAKLATVISQSVERIQVFSDGLPASFHNPCFRVWFKSGNRQLVSYDKSGLLKLPSPVQLADLPDYDTGEPEWYGDPID